jgi:cytochrome bd-type quinol oxidase subunit 2
MSSPSLDAGVEVQEPAGAVSRLLDSALGFFVWAAHFLAVYVATAVACQLGLGATSASARATFLSLLAIVTAIAIAIVVLHAVRRYRQQRESPTRRFRMWITIGGDAIATLAIAWQLFPILLVPVCA